MAELSDEIKAYEGMQADLEKQALGQWALVHGQKLIGTYETFDAAAREAFPLFKDGSCLIRQIGASSVIRARPL
jgi:hypothetical protein